MTTFLLPSFWLFFLYFFVTVFLAFYIPGNFFLKKLNLTPFQKIILSTVTGIALWGWQGFVFGFLGIRWMTYIYLFIFLILWIKSGEIKRIPGAFKKIKIKQLDFLLLALILVGTLLQLTSVFFVGITTTNGISFCCTPPDSLYHIALTNELIKQVPPSEPGMAGVIVHNYHYMSNLVSADLIRVFNLPLISTQYQYLTLLLSLLLGLAPVAFGQLLKMKKSFLRFLVFFIYFSGDITFVLTFLNKGGFNFNVPTLENSLWLWVSPPRVFAAVVFFAGMSLLYLWIREKKFILGILTAFVFASLVSFKIYDGIFMASGVAALFIYFLIKRQFRMIIPLLLTGILSLILYLPVNANSGGLVFTGGWRFENFISQPHLNLVHFEMAREIYASHHNWFGVARFEIFFALLYIIFVFGTLLFGIFQTRKSLAYFPREINIFLIPAIIISTILGFFFIQTSGGANSSQFLITTEIVGSIYTALACGYWIDKLNNTLKYIAIVIVVLLTIPRVLDTAHVYISQIYANTPNIFVDTKQLQALTYIKNNSPKNAVILADNLKRPQVFVYDKKLQKRIAIPVYDPRTWTGNFSYYLSFLSDRSLYIDGDANTNSIVQSHGVNTDKRIQIQKIILANRNSSQVNDMLHQNNIGYIYLESTQPLAKHPPKFLSVVFHNSEVSVLKIK